MRGTIKKKKPGIWELTVEYVPGGKSRRRQLSMTVHGTKASAQRQLHELVDRVASGRPHVV